MIFVCALRLKEALQEGSPSAGRCQDRLLQDPALILAPQASYKHCLGGGGILEVKSDPEVPGIVLGSEP